MTITDQSGLSSFAQDTFFTDVVAPAARTPLVDFVDAKITSARIRVDPLQKFRRIYFGIWAFGTVLDEVEVVATLSFFRRGKKFRAENFGWWSASAASVGTLSRNLVKPPFSVTDRTGAVPGNPMPITGGGVQDEISLIDDLNHGGANTYEVRLAPYRTVENCDEISVEGVVAVGASALPQFRVFLACHSCRENV
jgi:hypothetical protein